MKAFFYRSFDAIPKVHIRSFESFLADIIPPHRTCRHIVQRLRQARGSDDGDASAASRIAVLIQLISKPPETIRFAHQWRRPATWGFANGEQAARVDSLTNAAGGLQAKGRLSFKTGVFDAVELPKAARRALWDKNKKLNALSLKIVFEVVPAYVPKADETRHGDT